MSACFCNRSASSPAASGLLLQGERAAASPMLAVTALGGSDHAQPAGGSLFGRRQLGLAGQLHGSQDLPETGRLRLASEGKYQDGAEQHAERHHHDRYRVETAKSGESGHRSWSFWKHRFRCIVGICFAGSRAINLSESVADLSRVVLFLQHIRPTWPSERSGSSPKMDVSRVCGPICWRTAPFAQARFDFASGPG